MFKYLITSGLITTAAFTTPTFADDSPKPATMAQETSSEEELDVNDPLEPINRAIYFVNGGLDAFVMKPLAIAYRLGLPEPVRDGIGNFFQNLNNPVSIVNHMLQGEPGRAGNCAARLLINTTIGLAGLVDAADIMGIKPFDTTFNETMAVWGVNTGPYLVIPVLGPCSFRHGLGIAVDTLAKPQTYYFWKNDEPQWISYAVTGVEQLHYRNQVLEAVDDIVDNSADPYATFRSIYFQKQDYRLKELKGQADQKSAATESPRP